MRWITRRPASAWFAVLLAVVVPFLLALGVALWRTPYGISESIAILEDLERNTAVGFVNPNQPYFRPAFWLSLFGIWHGSQSVDMALALYKMVHIATVVLMVLMFVRMLRVRTALDAAAGAFAVAVLVGAPGFRDNLENLPLNQMMVIMLLTVVVWTLLERAHRLWHGPVIVALAVVAIGFKEQGLIISALVVIAWLTGAPGVGKPTVITTGAVTAAYLAMRLATMGAWPPFAQDVGLGFTMLSPRAAEDVAASGLALYGLYAYSAASTASNVLFSEPSAGIFSIIRDLARGGAEPWQVNHLVSSMALTSLIVWSAACALKRRHRGWTVESRVAVALTVALAGSAALGFNYTRDRFGGVAVIFYALAAYHAIRASAQWAALGSARRLVVTGTALLVLSTAWHVRELGTVRHQRESSWNNRKEWLVDLRERQASHAERPHYMRIMNAMVEQGVNPASADVSHEPRWAPMLLGHR